MFESGINCTNPSQIAHGSSNNNLVRLKVSNILETRNSYCYSADVTNGSFRAVIMGTFNTGILIIIVMFVQSVSLYSQ